MWIGYAASRALKEACVPLGTPRVCWLEGFAPSERRRLNGACVRGATGRMLLVALRAARNVAGLVRGSMRTPSFSQTHPLATGANVGAADGS